MNIVVFHFIGLKKGFTIDYKQLAKGPLSHDEMLNVEIVILVHIFFNQIFDGSVNLKPQMILLLKLAARKYTAIMC